MTALNLSAAGVAASAKSARKTADKAVRKTKVNVRARKLGFGAKTTERIAPKKFLIQLRARDNEFGVSEETFVRLMEELALNQTELVHKALRNLAKEILPAYEDDNGPLTDEQHVAIRKMSGMEITEADLNSPLFK